MVRRGAAQSISILAEKIEQEHSLTYLVPMVSSFLEDENDSVKIHAVYSTIPVANLMQNKDAVE